MSNPTTALRAEVETQLNPAIHGMAQYVSAITGEPSEDVLQHLRVAIWEAVAAWNPGKAASASTLAYKYCSNRAKYLVRAHTRIPAPEVISTTDDAGGVYDLSDRRYDPELIASVNLMSAEVERAISHRAPNHRWALGLYRAVRAGYAIPEIAATMKVSVSYLFRVWNTIIVPAVGAVTA